MPEQDLHIQRNKLAEYIEYKRDSKISKDMAADFGTDTVVMDFLALRLTRVEKFLAKLGSARRPVKPVFAVSKSRRVKYPSSCTSPTTNPKNSNVPSSLSSPSITYQTP